MLLSTAHVSCIDNALMFEHDLLKHYDNPTSTSIIKTKHFRQSRRYNLFFQSWNQHANVKKKKKKKLAFRALSLDFENRIWIQAGTWCI